MIRVPISMGQEERKIMFNIKKIRKDIALIKERNKMSDREIVEYYGQIWDNVKHMKKFIKELRNRYKEEEQISFGNLPLTSIDMLNLPKFTELLKGNKKE